MSDELIFLLRRALAYAAKGEMAYCNADCPVKAASTTARNDAGTADAFFDGLLKLHIHKRPACPHSHHNAFHEGCFTMAPAGVPIPDWRSVRDERLKNEAVRLRKVVEQFAAIGSGGSCGNGPDCQCHWLLIAVRELAQEALEKEP